MVVDSFLCMFFLWLVFALSRLSFQALPKCLQVFIDLLLRKSKDGRVSGGKDLASSSAYTAAFCSAIYAAWVRHWVIGNYHN